ncbi:disease resistance protein At4g27190-like [Gossypium arboreum]|uniref:disease resistance protein At4g27190-like n=1 Tax=Gossypium arboreum TaxID=29729 RepID=UPI0022F1A571|nr:disease resistance protein At4g27190-like [Gossypium arboreum]
MWDKVSLEEVGILKPSGGNGCKLVLTTVEACRKYMGCKVIKVKPFEEEALILFLNKVGPNIVQSPTIMPTLKLVVKECAGLPLTIVVVAGTMKGEYNPRIWKNALKDLKERIGKVEGVEAEVIERLKFSFDHLKDEKVKDCFLYCALYPEDFEIRKVELIECWIDEIFIDEMDTRQQMEDKGLTILKRLEDNCLLENITTKFGLPGIKMHDAVRDMALSITRMYPQYMIQAGDGTIEEVGGWTGRFEDINEFNKFTSSMQQSKKNLIKYYLQVGSYNVGCGRDKAVTIGGVQNWEGIECVVSLSSFAPSSAHPFQSLEVLYLRDLPKLSALIIKDEVIGSATTSTSAPSATFSHLNQIYVYRCSTMKTLLPHWLLPNLQHLEEIWVQECDELVEILGAAISEVEEKGGDALIKFHLPKLRVLKLFGLPNLKSICSKSGVMRIPPFVPLVGNGQPFAYAPPSLTIFSSIEWWELLEWDDHPNFNKCSSLQPFGG